MQFSISVPSFVHVFEQTTRFVIYLPFYKQLQFFCLLLLEQVNEV